MLEKLQIRNFKCFENHTVPFRPNTSVVVGRNNAGKSTIVEALRLIAIVSARYQSLNYHDVPSWLDIPRIQRGVAPDISNIEFNQEATFFQYADPPSIIEGTFTDGATITVYLGADQAVHAVIKGADGKPIRSRGEAQGHKIPRISIMPQIGPVAKTENRLSDDYIRRALSSPLSSSHFRNQLRVVKESFEGFKRLAVETWSGLKVISLESGSVVDSVPLRLLIRNEGFVADVGAMGHGLQMWLQTMWFLARTNSESTIILDEPDVYLHADLQRKLIRLLINQKRQVIVTTHSVEIMAEVDPENILIIDKGRSTSKFAATLPAVQRIIGFVGSSHNIHLARMWNSKRCLLVEGKDVSILKNVQNLLFPESSEPLDTIPNMPIGGWGGWNYALGSSMLIENSVGKNISVYCILDRDFHTTDAIKERLEQAAEKSVSLHIWQQKEIENYLLNPDTLMRFIAQRVAKRTAAPTLDEIVSKLDQIAEGMKDELFDSLSHELLISERSKGVHSANRKAREQIKEKWTSLQGKLGLVSGKEVLSQFSAWTKQEFGVQMNSQALSRSFIPKEIHNEMRMVVTAIENGEKFEKVW